MGEIITDNELAQLVRAVLPSELSEQLNSDIFIAAKVRDPEFLFRSNHLPCKEEIETLVDKLLVSPLIEMLQTDYDLTEPTLRQTKDLARTIRKYGISENNILSCLSDINLDSLVNPRFEEGLAQIRLGEFKQGLAFAYNLKRDYTNRDVLIIEDTDLSSRSVTLKNKIDSFKLLTSLIMDETLKGATGHLRTKAESFKLLKEQPILRNYFEAKVILYSITGNNALDSLYSFFENELMERLEDKDNGYLRKMMTTNLGMINTLFSRYVQYGINKQNELYGHLENGGKNTLGFANPYNHPLFYRAAVDSFNLGRDIGEIIARPTNQMMSNSPIFEVPEYKALIGLVKNMLLYKDPNPKGRVLHNHDFHI